MIESLICNLRMLDVPLNGQTNMFMENDAVYKNVSVP